MGQISLLAPSSSRLLAPARACTAVLLSAASPVNTETFAETSPNLGSGQFLRDLNHYSLRILKISA